MDNLAPAQRRATMTAIRSRDTKPELVVRRITHRLGYRFRLHRSDLPGQPDLTFPGRRKIIFVHGCFWHRHRCKAGRSMPKCRTEFWKQKFDNNVARDKINLRRLRRQGWKVLVVWECQTKLADSPRLEQRLSDFLVS